MFVINLSGFAADNDSTIVSTKKGTILYKIDFKKGFSVTDFANPGNWVFTKKGVTSTKTGLSNYLMLYRQYSVNKRKGAVRVTMGNKTRFNFFTVETDHFHRFGTLVQLDAAEGALKIYAHYNADSTLYPSVLINRPYKFIAGHDYTVSMMRDNNDNMFTITDHSTNLSDTVVDKGGITSGIVRDGFAVATESGEPPVVKSLVINTAYDKNMKVLYMGDSITEGLCNHPGLYSKYGAISGRSAGVVSGVQSRVWSELAILKPKYVVITIGTNGENSIANLTYLCQSIMRLGITPILNNIPWKQPASVVEDNKIIAAVRQNLGLKGALYDVATSIDGKNEQQDFSIFYDGVHPDAVGVKRMLTQLKKDVPELF
ncbi:hypothetical protein EOD41_02940 [Mucilaginibacter limnophilus]|uniref:SGNH/GDSL hydrolase family protein n=1 Tax=Mucilaginibacter limnophilus TaxID=1932778 RepID=A0A3S2X0Z0_9SPHI|nr:hypothetical protein [Mucilaginibacter limnophilus]RVU02910.1 hypothetical protein EOD41_02940 [Mucilaginibacter limnophilus]